MAYGGDVMKAPYSFPERSRAGMVKAIEAISSPYYDRPRSFAFSWNVKYPRGIDVTANGLAPYAQAPLDPALDDAWQGESEKPERFDWLLEDTRRDVDEYSTYPGEDQGAFEFGFYGRQGGHLCLESAFGFDLSNMDDLAETLRDPAETSFKDLRRLYRALVCMDSDFSRAKVRDAFAYAWAWQRMIWEEETKAERAHVNAAIAAEYEESRPDLYNLAY
jgi:hypothetical protein